MSAQDPFAAARAAVDEIAGLYAGAVMRLREALQAFLSRGERPDADARAHGAFCYPQLELDWPGDPPPPRLNRAWARLSRPGRYVTTLTRPDLYRDYLEEQIALLIRDYGATFRVGVSAQEIPYPYVLDGHQAWRRAGRGGLGRARPLVSGAGAGAHRRRGGRRPVGAGAGRRLAARPVRRPADRLLAGAPAALHGHAGRARPVLYSVHEL